MNQNFKTIRRESKNNIDIVLYYNSTDKKFYIYYESNKFDFKIYTGRSFGHKTQAKFYIDNLIHCKSNKKDTFLNICRDGEINTKVKNTDYYQMLLENIETSNETISSLLMDKNLNDHCKNILVSWIIQDYIKLEHKCSELF